MPKRVRPYGSAEDAESAGLASSQPRAGGELVSELGGTMTMREMAGQAAEAIRTLSDLASGGAGFASVDDAREVIASLQRMGQDLPQLCEQLARFLVTQREDGQIPAGPGGDPDGVLAEVSEALSAAGRAADMMAAALAEAGAKAVGLDLPSR